MAIKNIHYFVEGQCEKQLVDSIKKQPALIKPAYLKSAHQIFDKTLNDLINSNNKGDVSKTD